MSLTKKLWSLLILCLCTLVSTAHADNTNPSTRVPMVKTPLTPTELLGTLREGHVRVFGKEPSRNRLSMAWGQVAFENAHGKLSYNHNLGNVGPSKPDQPAYFNPADNHIYRSFDNFVDGAAAYWTFLKRCSAALVFFDAGNPTEAARTLRRCNYFEAPLDVYTPALASLYYYAYSRVFVEEQRERQQRQQDQAARPAERDAGTD